MAGDYTISEQQVLSADGVTLNGYNGATIILTAPVVPFLMNGQNQTIKGFKMTSNVPYPAEFIRIGGNGNRILGNVIYGPEQSGDSSTWVVNRGFVTQPSTTNVLISGNVFYSLRQPGYLNPDSTGIIFNIAAFNTRAYVVDGELFEFSGNSWGIPQNAVDIALLSGTATGAPYDPVSALESSNGNANISDQR